MSTQRGNLNIVFRPHWFSIAFCLIGSGGLLLVWLIVLQRLLQPPGWVHFYFVVMPALALLVGLVLSFASVRVSPEGLASRHFKRWFVRWEDVEAWSQFGPGGSVYVRDRDGRVLGFSSWCVYRDRCDRLAAVLREQLGPGATGEAAVAPRGFRPLVG